MWSFIFRYGIQREVFHAWYGRRPATNNGSWDFQDVRSHVFFIPLYQICEDIFSFRNTAQCWFFQKGAWACDVRSWDSVLPRFLETIIYSILPWLCGLVLGVQKHIINVACCSNVLNFAALAETRTFHSVRSHIFHFVYCTIFDAQNVTPE